MNLLQRVWQAARGQAVPAQVPHADRAYAAAQELRASLWSPAGSSATAEVGMAAAPIARRARDAVRNDPYAARIVDLWAGNAVGAGITTRWPDRVHAEAWRRWAESTACDAEHRLDLYGLQALVMRAVVESGECLVRLLPGEITPVNPIGLRLQVLESDHLDTSRNGLIDGQAVVQGIALDKAGAPTAYWLFRQHPGASWLSPGGRMQSEPRAGGRGAAHLPQAAAGPVARCLLAGAGAAAAA
jgi:capsid protein